MSGGGLDLEEDRFGCERLKELLCSLVLGFERRLFTGVELIVSATNTRVAMHFSVWLVQALAKATVERVAGDGGSVVHCR
jgi:hypothetical protein